MPTPEEIAATEKAAADAKAAEEAKKAAKAKEDADKAAKIKEDADKATKAKEDALKTFEEYLETLPEDQRKKFDEHVAGLKSALVTERALNRDGKTAAVRLKELEDAETKRKEAAMTEKERQDAKIATLESEKLALSQKIVESDKKAAVAKIAKELTFIDPGDAFSMIDLSKITVVDTDALVMIKGLLEALAKAKPYLLESDRGDGLGTPRGKGPKKPKEKDDKPLKPTIRF
jgi:hypothetical protein